MSDIGDKIITDATFVYSDYQAQANTTDFPPDITPPAGAVVDINGAVGPVINFDGGATGLTFSVTGNPVTLAGTLVAVHGGTGQSSYAQGDLLYASTTTALSKLAKDATATRYLSNTGASNNPAWAQINLTNGVTGVLPLANGGAPKSKATNVAPTVNDDNTQGYQINSLWTDSTGPTSYICQSATAGAAVWHAIP
jgi:hypothetical protein